MQEVQRWQPNVAKSATFQDLTAGAACDMNMFIERVQSMTRQAQKQATRARILEVARLHFERDGFEGASIRAIAEQAEVATGTVLLHFTDKASLLHSALHADLEAAIERSLRAASRGKLLARLCAVVRPFYSYYEERPRLSRLLLTESLLAKPPWRERFTAQALRVTAHVAELVEQAKARGEVSRSTNAQLFATAFASFYYFALIGWVQEGVPAPLPLFEALMAQHIAATGPGQPPAVS
jgi:AcrR family transcriptional regulator